MLNRFAQFRVATKKHGGKEDPPLSESGKSLGKGSHYLDTGSSQKRYKEGGSELIVRAEESLIPI